MDNELNLVNIKSINFLRTLYRNIWWSMSTNLKLPLKATSYLKKKKMEKRFENLLNEMVDTIESFPKEESERILWKARGNRIFQELIEQEESFKLGTLDENMKKQFFESTKTFINKCKEFDKDIPYSDIGQAMRNVWIVNILQKVIGMDITFTMAIFGYSMLYPYTDNYLDDVKVSMKDKKEFNNRFYKRLSGEDVKPKNPHEAQVFSLVSCIEKTFDRNKYAKVFEGLLLIHQCQVNSLTQQEGMSNPYERDMLDISIEKGGASVIVDGYLINGDLTRDEEVFTYGYGFLLQLCDDLQDVKIDYKNQHMTIMSQLAGKYDLDTVVNKLINLTVYVIDEANCFKGENNLELKKLIKDNCLLMIIFAIAMSREYFSKEYVKEISKYLPFTLSYIDNMKEKLQSKFKRVKSSYHGVSIEDIIYYLVI
ncbi:hypothetical protein [Clostridium sp.]|uniref:hypothetical protein n=1 Tax=Clostridium sp. TaxID=1506 RepID=UPI003217B3FA